MYSSLAQCVNDMEKHGHLVRIDAEVDANQEIAAIQRRAFLRKAPALLFTNVKNCTFPMLANTFGTKERVRFIFRHTLPQLQFLFSVKANPLLALQNPWKALKLLPTLCHALPKRTKKAPVLAKKAQLSDLPQLISWPKDGGAFITLPLVYSEHPEKSGFMSSNLGMYRIQLGGNDYINNEEVGLHYQIHRGIAAHHMAALEQNKPLPVRIFVGGPPCMTVSAVMPLPENLSELHFAGALGGRRIAMTHMPDHYPLAGWADADFCLSGHILPECKDEGPFGDHLGYYSLAHPFPVLKIDSVYHRDNAIWPFTSVGRPPQEDTIFGEFIHDLTHELVPQVFSGVHEVHAVDAAGVHPLLLTIGSERYSPFSAERRPEELLTCACNVLGTTQTSLAKYCLISAHEDDKNLSASNIPHYFEHILKRTHFERDLHFLTKTTIDTLDYSGSALNQGSKLIWAAAGKPCRELGVELPARIPLPQGFNNIKLFSAGIIVMEGPKDKRDHSLRGTADSSMDELAHALHSMENRDSFPLVLVVDDSDFTVESWGNFLWIAFTRSNPATDIYGVNARTVNKHWGCEAPLILDARLKSFQAPPLEEDPNVIKKIEALGVKGGPLYPYI